jgi:diguanylate cyclase (GGDEF)-like protein
VPKLWSDGVIHSVRPRARRSREAWRGWAIWRAPRSFAGYCIAVELLTLWWVLRNLGQTPLTARGLLVLALLCGIAILFEEGVSRAARLRLRMSSDLKRDMTSVWAVAAAVALPPGYAILLLALLFTYIWLRQQRPAGEVFSRKAFNAASTMVATLIANVVVHSGNEHWQSVPWTVTTSTSVVIAIVIVSGVNRALVTGGLVILGVRGTGLLGSRDDNLFELATLCLGGLAALAILHEPWLAILVLVPMIALQRGALVRELEVAAMTDTKTGLLNAAAWEQLAQRELARSRRERYDLAVLIIDLDRFKLVNDRFGHLVGDEVLKGIGRCLSAETRDYDTVGRFGGEEFVAVLPETSAADAVGVAERIRAAVNSTSVHDLVSNADRSGGADMLSVSIGVACSGVDGDELIDLLYEADRALYYAKENGRNQVQRARPSEGGRPQAIAAS